MLTVQVRTPVDVAHSKKISVRAPESEAFIDEFDYPKVKEKPVAQSVSR